jgi:predicted RNA-binding Zn-ribbon protein involved in translation (DUF1610 family)
VICQNCKKSNVTSGRKRVRRKAPTKKQSKVSSSRKSCRKCGTYLFENGNWSPSKVKKYDYICNTCNKKSSSVSKSSKKTNPNCPRCGKIMIVKTNRSDGSKFYGCPSFPSCRGTRPK